MIYIPTEYYVPMVEKGIQTQWNFDQISNVEVLHIFLLSISMKFKCRSHTCWAQKPIIKVANAREAQENESTVNSIESWNEVKFPVKIIYIFVLSYFIAFANID